MFNTKIISSPSLHKSYSICSNSCWIYLGKQGLHVIFCREIVDLCLSYGKHFFEIWNFRITLHLVSDNSSENINKSTCNWVTWSCKILTSTGHDIHEHPREGGIQGKDRGLPLLFFSETYYKEEGPSWASYDKILAFFCSRNWSFGQKVLFLKVFWRAKFSKVRNWSSKLENIP